ncbi:MAG TPA: efflux RND transporter periplasmic adaptor subunit [Anaerolineae bacterium]|nr:efflux RND transporter periplasmic adaptor subunit [Anaerolineae bacterium]
MKKRTWIIIGIVVIAACTVIGIISNRSRASAQSAASIGQTAQVTRTTVSSAVESSGSIAANDDVALAFGASGTVAAINVEVGDVVKHGDVLAKLDSAKLELQVARAEQAYLLQQATYSKTVQVDPETVTATQAALTNANNAYRIALQKSGLSSDQITVSCANLDDAKRAYDDAVTAYNNYLLNWRVQVNGTFEVSPQKARLDSAKAAYDVAQANCALAQRGVNDSAVKSAWAQMQQAQPSLTNLTSPRDEKLTIAQAQLEQAHLAWEQAKLSLADAAIVAPFGGVITHVNIKVGGPSGTSAAIELADVHQYHVDVLVDETEIAQIQPDQAAQITLGALSGITLTGKVAAIDPAGQVVQGVVNFNVRIDLDPTDAPLKLDMTTSARIIGESHADVMAVPINAIRSDAGGSPYVIVLDQQNNQRTVTVKTGLTQSKLTEVSGDLQVGDQVLVNATTRPTGFGAFGGSQ